MNELLTINNYQMWLITSVIISIIFLIGTIHFALVSGELRKKVKADKVWRIGSDWFWEFLKDIVHEQAAVIKNQNKQIKTDQGVIEKGIIRTLEQGIEIERLKLKETENSYLPESNKILIENYNQLVDEFNNVKKDCKYWKERALHAKHTAKKEVKSDIWESTDNNYPQFKKGEVYEQSNRKTKYSCLVWLISNGKTYLVNKSSFKPVKP